MTKKKEYYKVYFDRSILYPDGVDSSVAFLGAIRLALIAWLPKYDNICIKRFLITSVYSIVKLLFTSIGIFTYAENAFYMQFFISCIHSLKKSQ